MDSRPNARRRNIVLEQNIDRNEFNEKDTIPDDTVGIWKRTGN